MQSAVTAINIFDMAYSVPGNQANPYCAFTLGVAVALTILAYTVPVSIIENQVSDGTISHGTAAWKYLALVILVIGLWLGWKSLLNVLSAPIGALLGVVWGIHLMGAGIWAPWLDEAYDWKCKWGKLILIGAALLFGGLWFWHLMLSL